MKTSRKRVLLALCVWDNLTAERPESSCHLTRLNVGHCFKWTLKEDKKLSRIRQCVFYWQQLEETGPAEKFLHRDSSTDFLWHEAFLVIPEVLCLFVLSINGVSCFALKVQKQISFIKNDHKIYIKSNIYVINYSESFSDVWIHSSYPFCYYYKSFKQDMLGTAGEVGRSRNRVTRFLEKYTSHFI